MPVKNVPDVFQEFSNRLQECALQKLPILLESNNPPLRRPALRCVLILMDASITPGVQAIFSLVNASSSRNAVLHHLVKSGNLDKWNA